MQTLGERLEEARKRKGISIREAAEATKIRGDYLQKFEANSFDVDLPPLYVRGFLRSYARYLDLEPDRIVSDFDALGGRERKPARRAYKASSPSTSSEYSPRSLKAWAASRTDALTAPKPS